MFNSTFSFKYIIHLTHNVNILIIYMFISNRMIQLLIINKRKNIKTIRLFKINLTKFFKNIISISDNDNTKTKCITSPDLWVVDNNSLFKRNIII